MSQTAHKFDPSILREYDIRGIVGGTVHPADARAIGRTFGTMVRRKGGKHVALGYDGRLSSPELAAACIEGLTSAGVDVTNIGLVATPMLYFAVYHLDADGGIMITGSHNPPDYNGFKMRSEEHTSELQSRLHLVCRLLLEKKKKQIINTKKQKKKQKKDIYKVT